MANRSPYDNQNYIERAVYLWGDTYDYSLVEYTKSKNLVVIICDSHGPFEIQASKHISWTKPKGCLKCKYLWESQLTESFKDRASYKVPKPKKEIKWTKDYHREYRRKAMGVKNPRKNYDGLSEGERLVRDALEVLGIRYEREKRFPDCKDFGILPFDFYLPDYHCLIEYQGRQHYKAIKIFGGEDKFQHRQRKDAIKKQWAEDNGYLLLCIPYTVNRLDLIIKGLIERLNL